MDGLSYKRPTSMAEAITWLSQIHGRGFVLAGGTDLMLKMREILLDAELLLDIKGIPGLNQIQWSASGDLTIGAAVTMEQLAQDATLCARYPGLAQGARSVGSLQIRYRATLGGNLCNASPCMDTAPPLLLMDAMVQAEGPHGRREVPLQSFFLGVKKTALQPLEIATCITVPAASRRLRIAFDKIKRVRGHDLALVNAAVAYDSEAHSLRAAIGSCGMTPVLTASIQVPPRKEHLNAQVIAQELADCALERVNPIDDVRSSAEYRRDMVAMLCRKLTQSLLDGRGGPQ